MLNDARINAGKPALGFLNPWLYEMGYAGLNDITMGNNPGCGTEGFNSTIGWDPGMSRRFFIWLHSISARRCFRVTVAGFRSDRRPSHKRNLIMFNDRLIRL